MNALTNSDAFIQSLFAPLPDDAEPVMTIELKREWRAEIKKAWWRAWFSYEAARQMYDAVHSLYLLESDGCRPACFGNLDVSRSTCMALHRARLHFKYELLCTPAPTLAELRWKERKAPWWLKYHPDKAPRIAAAIAHDEERLARRAKSRKGERP